MARSVSDTGSTRARTRKEVLSMSWMEERPAVPTGEHLSLSELSYFVMLIDRIQFLDNGILQILSNATNGLSIVLEHRYYGDSIPVSSFSTDDLRWLNNAEALEDSAYVSPNLLLSLEGLLTSRPVYREFQATQVPAAVHRHLGLSFLKHTMVLLRWIVRRRTSGPYARPVPTPRMGRHRLVGRHPRSDILPRV